jgi:hypothetical protein
LILLKNIPVNKKELDRLKQFEIQMQEEASLNRRRSLQKKSQVTPAISAAEA